MVIGAGFSEVVKIDAFSNSTTLGKPLIEKMSLRSAIVEAVVGVFRFIFFFSSFTLCICIDKEMMRSKRSGIIDEHPLLIFIWFLKDGWIQDQLLQSHTVSLDDLVKKTIALEAACIESGESNRHRKMNSNTIIDTFKLSKSKHKSRREQDKSFNDRSFSKYTHSQSPKRRNQSRHHEPIDYRSLGIENLSLQCGKSYRRSSDGYTDRNRLKCNSFKTV
ncbi:hypothetical protein JTB14_012083 [Gonioctena quinquepunctata]|nr:hypothetical protein JTB14_012083 [Gonioctena quinquepunctata]